MSTLTHHQPEKARPWHLVALVAILLLAAFMNFYRLDAEGFGNLYYAAGVKSMLSSWHNFFFVSFDPGGFVTVDKPPLGLWIQTFSSMLFGFQGWSLLLPQALAGVLSVAVLYHLVARVFGPGAGLIAALVLALTPISVAANRNNTMDSLLVLTSLLAAWAASLAAERGRLRWLLLCALLVGIGFNIKMLQAFLVLPAFFLLYLFCAPVVWWKRILHMVPAGLLLVVVALSWAVVIDSTPVDQRPFIGSSEDNTVMELIVGHNGAKRLGGILRIFKSQNDIPPGPRPGAIPNPPQPPANQPVDGQTIPPNPPIRQPTAGRDETGSPGIFRLFNRQLAGQIAWFLPLSFFCFIAAVGDRKLILPLHPQHKSLLLWGMWLLPQVFFFSFAGLFHRYYLEMMAPAIAALVGAGFATMWRAYRWLLSSHKTNPGDRGSIWTELRGWMLPLVLLVGVGTTTIILMDFPTWAIWIVPPVVGLTLVATLGLIFLLVIDQIPLFVSKNRGHSHGADRARSGWAAAFASLGLIALILAPAVWSATPLLFGGDKGLPYAGPELKDARSANEIPEVNRLLQFLETNRGDQKFLLATVNARTAAPFILLTGEPVMAMGGFTGSDPILTAQDLEDMVQNNEVRFFLLPAPPKNLASNPPGNRPPPQIKTPEAQSWVQTNCRIVPFRVWRPIDTGQGPGKFNGLEGSPALWDCGL